MNNKIKIPETENSAFSEAEAKKRYDGNILNWGEEEWNILKPHLKNYRVCLDIGAHVGLTALRYAKFFKEVHAFEPIPSVFECLEYNTSQTDNITLYNKAVTDNNGVIKIFPNHHNTGSSVIPDKFNAPIIERRWGANGRFKDTKAISVPSTTIDSLSFKDVDLVKIDTEGHVLPVIEGMLNLLKDNEPVLQVEMYAENPNEAQMFAVNKILTEDYNYVKFAEFGYPADWFYHKQT